LTAATLILDSFPPARRDEPLVRTLAQRLGVLIDAPDLPQRLRALVALVDWTRGGAREAVRLERRDASVGGKYARWMLLLDTLERERRARAGFQATLAEIIAETEGENLFADAGLPGDRGFLAEFGDRLMDKLLPAPLDEHDLSRLLTRSYRTRDHAQRFGGIPPEVFEQIVASFAPADRPGMWAAVREAFSDGFRLLAARVQAQGLTEKMRARTRRMRVRESPFARLADGSEAVLAARDATSSLHEAASAWRAEHDACRTLMGQIRERLEVEGVSVDVVYGLDVLDRCLSRMGLMLAVLEAAPGAARAAAVHALLTRLIEATREDRSLRGLVGTNLQLLQRKIVERASQTGEHYIAWTRREYRHIWLAAAGGGLLTVLTAANEAAIHELQVPLFVNGLLAGMNYAVSFLLLQAFGLILATKQPAMTAAALGTIMREHHGSDRLDTIVTYAAQIVRSQLAAAIANVLLVALGAYAFSLLWQLAFGHTYLDREHAEHLLRTLSPVNSLTVWYAALTGVLLWLASLIGGWFDNWAAYHRLPQAIAEHPVGTRVGRQRLVRLAGKVSRNMAGWGTNGSLGLMLGLAPAVGAFFGLPLDVRHVTLNSGMLALAAAGLGDDWMVHGWFLLALAGVGTMFVLNLGVSFTLALYTATRAFGLPRGFLLAFFSALGRRFVREPGRFILPPGREDRAPAGAH
jgi:site-specific recombinase